MAEDLLLDAQGLMKAYYGRRVVNNVHINVRRGEWSGQDHEFLYDHRADQAGCRNDLLQGDRRFPAADVCQGAHGNGISCAGSVDFP